MTKRRIPLALAALTASLVPLLGTAHAAQARPATSWSADLTAKTPDQVNTALTGHRLTIRDRHFHPSSAAASQSYAAYTAPSIRLGRTVTAVTADTAAGHPAGSLVDTQVRGMDAAGRWSQWSTATAGRPVAFATPVGEVQVRLTLTAPMSGAAPTVSAVRLRAATAPRTLQPAAAVTYRVYATREGLVGGTTANGHVIANRDHFVALPSRRQLDANGSHTYQVTVCNGSRCETDPIWDVGPWNTKDDYWDSPRESWTDLAVGLPEAQAAYQNGYNGGHDEFGRQVANPAGIDLADGTFWDALGMTDNGYVTVTFNSSSPGTTKYWVDTAPTAAVYASATSTAQTGTLYAATNYVYCKVWGRMIGNSSVYNHYWLRTDPDVGPANQYVSAYYLSRWGNDEAKDNNGTVIPDC